MIECQQIKNEKKMSYPILKISDIGQIILFTSEKTGFNINGVVNTIGHYSNCWCEEAFKLYDGVALLKNI